MKIAIFGGSFDPPHVGHQLSCLYVLSTEAIDELWIVPTHVHAFGKALTPFEHRLEMCRLVAEPLGRRARVSDVERARGGVSRTADTVRHLLATRPGDELSLIVGADLLAEIPSWYDGEALQKLVPFIVVGRNGYVGGPGLAMPEVSSSTVRDRLRKAKDCHHLMPRSVLEYIAQHGLYGATE